MMCHLYRTNVVIPLVSVPKLKIQSEDLFELLFTYLINSLSQSDRRLLLFYFLHQTKYPVSVFSLLHCTKFPRRISRKCDLEVANTLFVSQLSGDSFFLPFQLQSCKVLKKYRVHFMYEYLNEISVVWFVSANLLSFYGFYLLFVI